MRKSILLSGLILSLIPEITAGDVPALSTFQNMTAETTNPVVFFEGFEGELSPQWQVPETVKLEEGEGVTGTRALVLSRTEENASEYERAVAVRSLPLTPGKYYRVSACYRTEGVRDGLRVGTILSVKPDNDLAPVYPEKFPDNSTAWKTTEFVFRAGELNRISICLWWDVTGKAYWDDIRVEEVASNQGALYVKNMALRLNDEGTVELRGTLWGKTDLTGYSVILEAAGQRLMKSFDAGSEVKFNLGGLPDGEYPCQAYIVDLPEKKILVKQAFTLFRNAAAEAIHGAVSFRADGCPLLNGEPFFPIGIFVSHLRSEADLKRIAEGGFNFLIHYRSFDLNIHGGFEPVPEEPGKEPPGRPDPKREATPEWQEQVRRSLDLVRKYDLKYIPTWGGEPAVFRHDAVLARYTADEVPATRIPALAEQRKRIARNHPFHPVIALTNRPADFFAYAQIGDVLGYDNYPVEGKNDKNRSLLAMRSGLSKAREAGIRLMFVPQAFNWGAFRPTKDYKTFDYPTGEEIRSMTLLPVIFGVRWFCFYDYNTIFGKQEMLDPGSSRQCWDDLTATVKLLGELRPWLFSREEAGEITLDNQKDVQVDVKAFRKDGKLCILIVSSGPSEAEAVLTVGKDGLRSKFGHTTACGDGKYRFTSNGIASDILVEGEPEPSGEKAEK